MKTQLDVLIVGAGFAGIYALHKFRKMGLNAKVVDAAGGVGGTWYWNGYPGARCDVESLQYSYSFDEALQQEWQWTERYAPQAEILDYLKHVVKRFELMDGIQLDTRVNSAQFHKDHWQIETSKGNFSTRFVIMATGCLSKPNKPKVKGLESFKGECYETGRWPVADSGSAVNLENKRVAVIGTGSSGVQLISEIAEQVESLTVFQRTPHWVVPAGNHPLSEEESDSVKAAYSDFRKEMQASPLGMNIVTGEGSALELTPEERTQRYDAAWNRGGATFLMSFNDLLVNDEANLTACEFVSDKIKEIIEDPEVAATLTPDSSKSQLGARRMVQDDNYYSRYNLSQVHLIDTRKQAIESFNETGISTSAGHIEFDVIVFAIGFDALTGALLDFKVQGLDGLSLNEKWQQGAKSYLGIGMHGFPNLFTVTGPGSPSVFSNVVVSIEQHIDWIADAIGYVDNNNYTTIEASAAAEENWGEKVVSVSQGTVIAAADSWYFGSNIPGKPRVLLPYLGGVGTYRNECNEIAKADYKGFVFT